LIAQSARERAFSCLCAEIKSAKRLMFDPVPTRAEVNPMICKYTQFFKKKPEFPLKSLILIGLAGFKFG
jgi:hypothetical protein